MTQDSNLIGEENTEEDVTLVALNCEINNSEINLIDCAKHDFNNLIEVNNTETCDTSNNNSKLQLVLLLV